MKKAAADHTVRVHYTGTFEDGTQFDSSAGGEPIRLTLGQKQVIAGFEAALMGMTEGESKSVTIAADDAYGPHNPELVYTVERTRIPPEVDLAVGIALQTTDQDGNEVHLVVIEMDDDNVTLDANHPLAGKVLIFDLQLVDFVE